VRIDHDTGENSHGGLNNMRHKQCQKYNNTVPKGPIIKAISS